MGDSDHMRSHFELSLPKHRSPVRTNALKGAAALLLIAACSGPNVVVDSWPAIVVAGRVQNSAGGPAPDVDIRAELRAPSCADGILALRQTRTSTDGSYAVTLTQPATFEGCVRVRATAPGKAAVTAERAGLVLEPTLPPSDTAIVDLELP